MQITIDPEFQAAIPALSDDERSQLEANILAEGCRDPLVLWGDVLIDGHNRLAICTYHGLPFETVQREFADRDAALEWIECNQLGRRNLSPEARKLLIGNVYNRRKRQGARTDLTSPQIEGRSQAAEQVASEFGTSRATVERAGAAAAAVAGTPLAGAVTGGKARLNDAATVASATTPEEQAEIVAHGETAILAAAKEIRELKNRPHVANNSGNNEWYTPPHIIEAARRAMGAIDTDPASSDVANRTVQADTYYTAVDDGLSQKWHGNVWLNPPYAQPLMSQFADAVVEKWQQKSIVAACVLVNNATETVWFQHMLQFSVAVCFIRSRVKYLDATGAPANTPLQGQAVVYFGNDVTTFAQAFSDIGTVLTHV